MMSSIALPAGLRDQFGTEAESKDQISAWLMKICAVVAIDALLRQSWSDGICLPSSTCKVSSIG